MNLYWADLDDLLEDANSPNPYFDRAAVRALLEAMLKAERNKAREECAKIVGITVPEKEHIERSHYARRRVIRQYVAAIRALIEQEEK